MARFNHSGRILLLLATLLLPGPARADGAVTVEVKGGTLVITGDADDNRVRVTHPVGYRVQPSDAGTLINGSTTAQDFPGATKGVRVDLGAGSDVLVIDDRVSGPLSYRGAGPQNLVNVNSATVEGNIDMRTGDGFDRLKLNGSVVEGVVRAKLGDGNGEIKMESGSDARKDVRLEGGSDHEQLSITNSGISGRLLLKAGDGGSDVFIGAALVGKGIKVSARDGSDAIGSSNGSVVGGIDAKRGDGDAQLTISDSTISGNVKSKSGHGADTFSLDLSVVEGNVQLASKNGDTSTGITKSAIEGNLQIKRGAGDDALVLVGPGNTVDGKVSVKNGPGGSNFTAIASVFAKDVKLSTKDGGADHGLNECAFDGSLKIDAGRGGGSLFIEPTTTFATTVEKDLSFRVTDGVLSAGFERLVVGGRTKIQGGGGFPHGIAIDDSSLEGPLSIKTGLGSDFIGIETQVSLTGFASVLAGKVAISTGDADDLVIIGNNDAASQAIFGDTVGFNGGKGNDTLDHLTHANVYPTAPPQAEERRGRVLRDPTGRPRSV